jgi:hypothetical protein
MATTSHMFMYSLTIQPPTAITQAILGQFAGTRDQQIVTASGSKLTIHRPDPAQGKITPLFSQDVFGIIRSLAAFRVAGSSKGMSLFFPPPLSAPLGVQLSDSPSFPGSTVLLRTGPLKEGSDLPWTATLILAILYYQRTVLSDSPRLHHHRLRLGSHHDR